MAFLPSLPAQATVVDVVRAFKEPMLHLNPFVQSLMRGPSPLSEGERELIAAYVSGLNDCAYCHGVHSRTARAFGVPEPTFAALMADVDTAPVDERLKPILRYVRKLTESPGRMTQRDADAVFAAGWDETALFHAVAVCAHFNLMNRIVQGTGVAASPERLETSGRMLAEHGYTVVKRLALGEIRPEDVGAGKG